MEYSDKKPIPSPASNDLITDSTLLNSIAILDPNSFEKDLIFFSTAFLRAEPGWKNTKDCFFRSSILIFFLERLDGPLLPQERFYQIKIPEHSG